MLSKMRDVLAKITKSNILDENTVNDIVTDIQRILITSDVNISLVKQLSDEIKKQALEEKLPPGVNRKEHLAKIVYDQLVKILGGYEHQPRMDPHKILLCGLYGSGKTTTIGKLAKFYSKRGLKTCMITTDIWRPAAFEQVKQLGQQIDIPVFGDPKEKDPVKILDKALQDTKGYDLILVDSAGRDSLDDVLLKEIIEIQAHLNAEEKYLVISADIGQTAIKQAEAFNRALGLTGVIVTKADSSGKAGGALSACHIAKVPVTFVGTGEKMDDFQVFNAEKFVSRLLGYGDLGELVKKVQEAVEETEFNPEDILKKDYNLDIFYKQLEATKKMGPLKKVFEMLGMGQLPDELVQTGEEKMKGYKIIMDSMTKHEKENPDDIKSQRIARIASGSGKQEQDVKELIKQFNTGKKMIQKLKKGKRPRGGM